MMPIVFLWTTWLQQKFTFQSWAETFYNNIKSITTNKTGMTIRKMTHWLIQFISSNIVDSLLQNI